MVKDPQVKDTTLALSMGPSGTERNSPPAGQRCTATLVAPSSRAVTARKAGSHAARTLGAGKRHDRNTARSHQQPRLRMRSYLRLLGAHRRAYPHTGPRRSPACERIVHSSPRSALTPRTSSAQWPASPERNRSPPNPGARPLLASSPRTNVARGCPRRRVSPPPTTPRTRGAAIAVVVVRIATVATVPAARLESLHRAIAAAGVQPHSRQGHHHPQADVVPETVGPCAPLTSGRQM
ncbi:hypothetical protein B0H15DRAFT_944328 [Mycena belliarum]|uniref:Uncharacterized protein n=1 Tax=Mycena belliarum TaxID=1033014 RepID=A0AAD6UFT6_9AGAR|nr:hypothetical protein B0H15DRAFT_944328 [Mycena belliae]